MMQASMMFFSMLLAAAVAADETVAVTSSLAERELKADAKLISNGSSDGSSVVSYFHRDRYTPY